jgi:hypothetical protein
MQIAIELTEESRELLMRHLRERTPLHDILEALWKYRLETIRSLSKHVVFALSPREDVGKVTGRVFCNVCAIHII